MNGRRRVYRVGGGRVRRGVGIDFVGAHLDDPADMALAYARQANVINDPVQVIQFYQTAIDNYAALGATTQANTLLDICGSRNCTGGQ